MNYHMSFGSAMAMELPVSGDAAFLASFETRIEEMEEELEEMEATAYEDDLDRQFDIWQAQNTLERMFFGERR